MAAWGGWRLPDVGARQPGQPLGLQECRHMLAVCAMQWLAVGPMRQLPVGLSLRAWARLLMMTCGHSPTMHWAWTWNAQG